MPYPIGLKRTKLAARAIAVAAAYEGAQSAFDRATSFYRENFQYSVTITDEDPIYDDLHAWLLRLLPAENARSLLLGARDYQPEYGQPISADPALIRPGRMDCIAELASPTWREVSILFERFYQRPLFELSGPDVADQPAPPMSTISEVMKQYLDKPEMAAVILMGMRMEELTVGDC